MSFVLTVCQPMDSVPAELRNSRFFADNAWQSPNRVVFLLSLAMETQGLFRDCAAPACEFGQLASNKFSSHDHAHVSAREATAIAAAMSQLADDEAAMEIVLDAHYEINPPQKVITPAQAREELAQFRSLIMTWAVFNASASQHGGYTIS